MSTELTTQIRDYFDYADEQQGAVDIAIFRERGIGDEALAPHPPPKRRGIPGWAYALATAVVVLLVAGGLAWLIGPNTEVEPADEVTPTTVLSTPTTISDEPSPRTSLKPASSTGVLDVSSLLWTPAEVEGSEGAFMRDVAFGSPGFVAAGQGLSANDRRIAAFWFSENGDQWSRGVGEGDVFPEPSRINAVAYGPQGYVAVGTNGDIAALWRSEDGKVWSRLPHNSEFENDGGRVSMEGVAYGGSGWVAVGWEDDRAAIWVSPDGRDWVRAPDSSVFDDAGAEDVTYGSGLYVSVGADTSQADWKAVVWVSEDGQTWLQGEIPSEATDSTRANSVAYGDDRFVAVGSGFWLSSDGLNWTQATTDVSPTDGFSGVAWGGDGFIAAGTRAVEATAVVITVFSGDGLIWTASSESGFDGDQSRTGGIAFGNDRFVTVGGEITGEIGNASATVGTNPPPQ